MDRVGGVGVVGDAVGVEYVFEHSGVLGLGLSDGRDGVTDASPDF